MKNTLFGSFLVVHNQDYEGPRGSAMMQVFLLAGYQGGTEHPTAGGREHACVSVCGCLCSHSPYKSIRTESQESQSSNFLQ